MTIGVECWPMLLHQLRALDDVTALHVLAVMAGAQKLVPAAAPSPAEVQSALALWGAVEVVESTATVGDVARAALVLASQDPETADGLQGLLEGGMRSTLEVGALRDLAIGVAVSLLRARFKVEGELPGGFSFQVEKPVASDAALVGLIRALGGALPRDSGVGSVQGEAAGAPPLSNAPSLFVVRARPDEHHAAELRKHLAPWLSRGELRWWTVSDILPGSAITASVQEHLDSADIIVFLVSADYLHSPAHIDHVRRALSRHDRHKTHVIPVLVRPCAWEKTDLAALQPLPKNHVPVANWPTKDDAWLSVVQEITGLLPVRQIEQSDSSKVTPPASSGMGPG